MFKHLGEFTIPLLTKYHVNVIKKMACSCCFEDLPSKTAPCQFCEFTTCVDCQKTYTLGTSSQPHCMSCKKEWSDEHVDSIFTKKFINQDLKQHRETILMERQKVLLPGTQPHVHRYNRSKYLLEHYDEALEKYRTDSNAVWAIHKNIRPYEAGQRLLFRIDTLGRESELIKKALVIGSPPQREITKMQNAVATIKSLGSNNTLPTSFNAMFDVIPTLELLDMQFRYDAKIDILESVSAKMNDEVKQYGRGELTLQEAIEKTADAIDRINENVEKVKSTMEWDNPYQTKSDIKRNLAEYVYNVSGDAMVREKHTWTWACPGNECRGYLDNKHVCGVCETKFCKDCNEPREEGHKCDEDTKKTVRMLKRDSKPCPKCSAVIHKIDGCDQMWCPDCKTAFSWQRGTIEKTIHNPHYYEYLRNTQGFVPRTEGDEPGGCQEDNGIFLRGWRNQRDRTMAHPTYGKVWRAITHMDMVMGRRYRDMGNTVEKECIWRVKYMVKEMAEDQWKRKLQIHDKALRKRAEIRSVIDTFVQLGCDILRETPPDGFAHLDEKVEKYHTLATYFQGVFAKISKRYGCVVPCFTSDHYDVITLKY